MQSLIKRLPESVCVLLTAVIIVFAGIAACQKSHPSQAIYDNRPPILLIGVDGMEWNIALHMLHEGRLPEIQRLIQRGTYGLLETRRPTSSPILWTSIATGKVPEKHGILGFVHRTHKKGEYRQLFTNADRKTKAFWNILSDYGRTVSCIGWWVTFPVEPIRGVMVAQTNTLRWTNWQGSLLPNVEGQIYPVERQKELMGLVKETDHRLPVIMKEIFGETNNLPSPDAIKKPLERAQWAFRADAIYENIAMKLVASGSVPDLTALYFGGTDVVQHLFWQYMEPTAEPEEARPSAEEIRLLGHIIPDYYAHIDNVIGKLLRLYPKETTVIIISDHGMTAEGHHTVPPPPAFLLAAGPYVRKMEGKQPQDLERSDLITVGSVLDITPTLLAMKGIPPGADMDGKVMETILHPAFLSQKRPAPVPTHDTTQWLASRPKVQQGTDVDPEREEQLRALGYIN